MARDALEAEFLELDLDSSDPIGQQDDEDGEPRLPDGFALHPVLHSQDSRHQRGPDGRPTTETRLLGFLLKTTDSDGRIVYTDRQNRRDQTPTGSLFRAERDAAAFAWASHRRAEAARENVGPVTREWREVGIPRIRMCLGVPEAKPAKLTINLSAEEATKLDSLLEALRLHGAMLAPGEPVQSRADALRHLLLRLPHPSELR